MSENFLRPLFTNVGNKLESLSLAGLSSLIEGFWVRPSACSRVEHVKGISVRYSSALLANSRLGCKGLSVSVGHSSLLQTFVFYSRKKFLTLGPDVNGVKRFVINDTAK